MAQLVVEDLGVLGDLALAAAEVPVGPVAEGEDPRDWHVAMSMTTSFFPAKSSTERSFTVDALGLGLGFPSSFWVSLRRVRRLLRLLSIDPRRGAVPRPARVELRRQPVRLH